MIHLPCERVPMKVREVVHLNICTPFHRLVSIYLNVKPMQVTNYTDTKKTHSLLDNINFLETLVKILKKKTFYLSNIIMETQILTLGVKKKLVTHVVILLG